MIGRMVRLCAVAGAVAAGVFAQGGRGAAAGPPPTAKASAPIDLTGYWVSQIVDEWRFRVSPQKGDIPYLPLNPAARTIDNAWDPDKDVADGKQCKAYGAVGVMQRPGRLHIEWADDNTLRIDADAGTQTRMLRFAAAAAQAPRGEPTWQGNSTAQWQMPAGRGLIDLGGIGFVAGGGPNQRSRNGTLKVTTTNLLPGYIRKNGVPYSDKAVVTEYFNRLEGAQNDVYFVVTAMVDDPTYLTGPFVRSYQFKKQDSAAGWDPTPCLPR
jgi:hypothetical protein